MKTWRQQESRLLILIILDMFVFFVFIYIASETCNVNVNCFAMKGMKIDYVRMNLFEVYGMPIDRHVVRRAYSSNVRYCSGRITYYSNGIAAFTLWFNKLSFDM